MKHFAPSYRKLATGYSIELIANDLRIYDAQGRFAYMLSFTPEEIAWLADALTPNARPRPRPRHVCGLQGFDGMKDECPACSPLPRPDHEGP